MSDCSTTDAPGKPAERLASARVSLEPLLVALIDALADNGDTASFFAAGAFVQDLLERLRVLEQEEELLHLLLDISLISFQGFELSDQASTAVDSLLSTCESMTRTLTAGQPPH